MQIPAPVTLSGAVVRLEPLTPHHHAALAEVGLDQRLWAHAIQPMLTADDVRAYIEAALAEQAAGRSVPFVQVEVASGTVVGSTRYMNIDVYNGRLEIGASWINPRWQRSGINTESKLLLLTHAFEELECIRVEFKGDARNVQSREALERIGAEFEGVLRQHMRNADGFQRDSFYYSILSEEWPAKKAHIRALLRTGV
jgi:RimJ/RimL family protein N-acetyltransferase